MGNLETSYQLKSKIDKYRPLNTQVEKKIFQKLRLEWNYNSNKIEGNSLTYGETKALILFGITAQGKPLKDHFEITGHDQAVKWVFDIIDEDRGINQAFIRELHTLILKEPYFVDAITPDGNPTRKKIEVGKYKSSQNHVITKTGETFYFAEPEETPAKMGDLIEWYNKSQLDVITKAATFHYKFILIHPFDDGNGRTARILMNFILMSGGFPPSVISIDEKEEYFSVLRLADAGKLNPFIDFIAKSVNKSMSLMIDVINGVDVEEPTDIDKEVVLLKEKFFTSQKLVETFKSKSAINTFIENNIERFTIRFYERLAIFEDFYNLSIKSVSINDTSEIYDNDFSYLNHLKNDELASIDIVYRYFNLRSTDAHEINHVSKMGFRFEEVEVEVEIVAYEVGKLTKVKYSDVIDITTIDNLINHLISKHKDVLESRIK